jgi:ABC-2 type transport system permease protein
MFKEIFLFEVRQGLKKLSTYIFFSVFFLIYLLLGLIAAGVIPMATGDTNVYVNSASAITSILISLNGSIQGLLNSTILVALIASAIQKDYEYNMHPLLYTKPIKKSGYYFGRFLGAFTVTLFVFSAQILGYLVACLIGTGNSTIGPFHLMNFLEPFFLFTVPNVLWLGIIFFALTTFTRSTMSAYLFCIILLVLRSITDIITADIDNKTFAAILEPFGQEAFQKITEYWTPHEQNKLLIPLKDELLINRILWFGIAVIITIIGYLRFQFSQFLAPITLFKRKTIESLIPSVTTIQSLSEIPVAQKDFSTRSNWIQLFYLANFEFKKMVKSNFFIIICVLGVVTMYIIFRFLGVIYGTETYPVTYNILGVTIVFFHIFIAVLIVFFSGTIIWRDRENKEDELIGTTPVSNDILFFSKYLALIYVTATLLFVIMLTGISIQLTEGFRDIQLMQYVKTLFGMRLIGYIISIGLCLSVQVLIPNKYLGFFISVMLTLVLGILARALDWANPFYIFNSSGPLMLYSDMNGFGHIAFVLLIFKTYWLAIIVIISLLAIRFFPRGKESGLKARYRLSRFSIRRPAKLSLLFSIIIACGVGSFIYYNIKVLNKFITSKEQEQLKVDYEKHYKKYQSTLQPRVVESKVDVDIFPCERSLHVKGFYYLKNKHNVYIDTVFLSYDPEMGYKTIELSVPNKIILDDKEMGVKLVKLSGPLAPGDSIKLDFELNRVPHGFKSDDAETDLVYNGTFFNNGLFPSLGYIESAELIANSARKKYGLKEKPRMHPVNDSLARMNTYITNDADQIRFETTVSTSPDQIAIAPGYLQKEWTENGRRYFHYKMDSPILNFYSFLSARYEVKRDKWNNPHDPDKPVNIEIFYHKGHEYDLDKMILSIKRSLDYYTKNFSPYQHKQVRIIEFPRYNSFAQSFPNTVPFSESIGFIAKVNDKDPESIDYPFYVTAHEVAHQWWAHQVIGGNVQGSTVMSETMSQYSALMVMEKEFGRKAMKKFLKYEMNTYLQQRTLEKQKELPLMLCEDQQYIHYNKGSVVMYALKDYIGEDTLNAALRRYLAKTAFQQPPYTNSVEFVNVLKAATPDSLKYIITDMFETITMYENYVKELSYTQMKNGKYKVVLTVGCAKFRVDSIGKSKKINTNDYIDIGIFSQDYVKDKNEEKELLLLKVKMDKPEKKFEFIVNEKPFKAGIDPYNKLIDRKPENNTCEFGKIPEHASLEDSEGNLTISLGAN